MANIFSNKVLLTLVGLVVAVAAGYGIYSFAQSDNDDQAAGNNSQTEGTQNDNTDQSQANSNGEETVEGGLVSGFPGSKVPLYRGDVVKSTRSTDSQGRPEYAVRIATTDSFDKVDDWTRISYVNEGWDIRVDNKTPLGGTMIVAHSDEYINTITYNEQDGGVTIDYGITTK